MQPGESPPSTDRNNLDLLPCPLCNSQAGFLRDSEGATDRLGNPVYAAYCENEPCDLSVGWFSDFALLVRLWNAMAVGYASTIRGTVPP